MARLFERHLAKAVEAALSDTRVVAVTGARQAGKSTLVHAQMTGRAGEERTRDGVAVDGVLESADGRVVGVEVKCAEAAAPVDSPWRT